MVVTNGRCSLAFDCWRCVQGRIAVGWVDCPRLNSDSSCSVVAVLVWAKSPGKRHVWVLSRLSGCVRVLYEIDENEYKIHYRRVWSHKKQKWSCGEFRVVMYYLTYPPRLLDQIQEWNGVPLPTRRTPSTNGNFSGRHQTAGRVPHSIDTITNHINLHDTYPSPSQALRPSQRPTILKPVRSLHP